MCHGGDHSRAIQHHSTIQQSTFNINIQQHPLPLLSILNKVTPEKYNVLFEDLWLQLVVDGQVDVMGIVEQVIYTAGRWMAV